MRSLRKTLTSLSPAIIFVSVLCGIISGQSALTTIQDTLFDADGARYNGTLTIRWSTFDTTNPGTIIQQTSTVQVVNGNLLVQLAPNSAASPPANVYTVLYQSDGDQQYSETWTVPAGSTPLKVAQVRIGTGGTGGGGTAGGLTGGTGTTESAVTNLVSDLNARPIKGPGFGTNAVAVIDQNGQIETAVGNLGDCVFVDGTTGPCSAPVTFPSFVNGETPGGLINGINTTFTLVNTPSGSSLLLFRNGLLLQAGIDYTLNGSTIQFAGAAIPQTLDTLLAQYRIDPGTGLGSGPATGPSGVPGANGCGAVGTATKTSFYQIQAGDNGYLMIQTGNANFALPVTVPAAGWCVVLLDTNAAGISVVSGSNQINGTAAGFAIQSATTVYVLSDGRGYWVSGSTGPPGATGSTGAAGPVGFGPVLCNGSASATAATCPGIPAPVSYGTSSNGYLSGTFIAGATSTAALTLNVNGLGTKAVFLNGTVPSALNAVVSGAAYSFYYDGTQIQLTQAPSRPVCALASSVGFLLNGTDESTLFLALLSAWYSSGTGGCLAIDAGKTLRIDSQITTPANAAGSSNVCCAGLAPPYRITGAGGMTTSFGLAVGGGLLGFPPPGSTLDLRYHGSGLTAYQGGPKLLAVGQGTFELDHLNITTGASSDCATFIMITGAVPYLHDLVINGTGCNGGIVLGGSGPDQNYPANTPLSTAVTQWWNGYGGSVENVKLNGVGNATAPAVLLQSNVNQMYLRHLWIGNGGSSTAYLLNGGQSFSASAGDAIYINGNGTGGAASRSNVIDEGIIEFGPGVSAHQYVCAIHLHNATGNTITNMGWYDGDSSAYDLCGDSTAINNRITNTNYTDLTPQNYTNSNWSATNLMPYRNIATFTFDGGGSAMSGSATRCSAPTATGGVIRQFSMFADQSGSATVSIGIVAAGSYTGPGSITPISGSETMNSAVSLIDTTLSGWTYASLQGSTWLPPGSVICATLSSPSTITWLTGSVQILEGR